MEIDMQKRKEEKEIMQEVEEYKISFLYHLQGDTNLFELLCVGMGGVCVCLSFG